MAAPDSLRRLLTLWLVAPLLALILVSAIPGYFLAVRAANDAYDNGLLDPATAIANYVRENEDETEVIVPPAAIDALRIDTIDKIFFQVTGPDRDAIAGNADIPRPATDIDNTGQLIYSSAIDGQAVRVAAISFRAATAMCWCRSPKRRSSATAWFRTFCLAPSPPRFWLPAWQLSCSGSELGALCLH